MNIRTAVALSLMMMGGPAFAAGASKEAVKCVPFDQKGFSTDGFKFNKLTPGQMNFLRGVWSQSDTLPGMFPPGDGGALLTHAGKPGGIILFMKGALACPIPDAPQPFLPVTDKFLKMLGAIHTGALDPDGFEI